MDKLRKYRKKLIIALTALLVLMLSISIVYGKYTSSRVSVVDLTVKHTVTLTLNANLPPDKTGATVNISTIPIVLSEQETGTEAKVVYPSLPMDKFLDSANGVELEGYVLDGWTLEDGTEVKSGQEITVKDSNNKPATEVTLYAKWKKNEPQEIGGDIFYIDPKVNGAVYKFYDAGKNEITDWDKGTENEADTLTALESAKYYLKVGSNTDTTNVDPANNYKTDKFYVVAKNETTTSTLRGTLGTPKVEETSDALGKGRSNTKTFMDAVKIISESPETVTYPTGTIWKALDDFIKEETNTNKDWYIGSKAELEKYKEWNDSLFSAVDILTSTKDKDTHKIYFWNSSDGKWDVTASSTDPYNAIPMRSF